MFTIPTATPVIREAADTVRRAKKIMKSWLHYKNPPPPLRAIQRRPPANIRIPQQLISAIDQKHNEGSGSLLLVPRNLTQPLHLVSLNAAAASLGFVFPPNKDVRHVFTRLAVGLPGVAGRLNNRRSRITSSPICRGHLRGSPTRPQRPPSATNCSAAECRRDQRSAATFVCSQAPAGASTRPRPQVTAAQTWREGGRGSGVGWLMKG